MSVSHLASAHRLLVEAVDGLADAVGDGSAGEELLSALTLCEGTARRLDRIAVSALAMAQRRGVFTERGYPNTSAGLSDLLGWDRFESRRRITVAEQVCPRIGLDGTSLPPLLPATASVLEAGRIGLRHVEAIAQLLASPAAGRLAPVVRAGAEAQLAEIAGTCSPSQLLSWGTTLIDTLDQDGPEPDERPPAPVNELTVARHRGAPGGTIKGRFDDAAMFDAIAAVIDAKARPLTADDERTPVQRQAEALADVCGYVLDHGDVPACGGHRPHLNVIVRLDDLQNRARAAALDFGGTLSPEGLRMLACDAAVVPIVMNGKGQPLDVGRLTRVIPDGLRRAVAARDRGCARCGRPSSWCEIHHVVGWENGGETKLGNCVQLCRACHRLVHHSGWEVRVVDGLPEFYPPTWIDPEQRARQRPPPRLGAA